MKLVLVINNQPAKEWPLEMPQPNPHLSDLQNFELRKAYVDDIVEKAKADFGQIIGDFSYEFVIEGVKAFIQPKNISKPADARFNNSIDGPGAKVIKMTGKPGNYLNVKSMNIK